MEAGVGVREAARRVGVNYRTAKRWRAGAAQAAAVPVEVSSRLLSLQERIRIADRVREPGVSLRAIAAELGRPVSTISRELDRNQQPDGTYQPHAAHERATVRRARPKVGKLVADPVLRAIVQDGLDVRWSPQQITRRLRRDYPDRPEWHVSWETIYQALYLQARGGLRREVAGWLRSGRIQRRPHVRPDQRRPRMATPMVMISDRPAEVADRAVPGHWEGDLIMGAHNRCAIGTLVERNTRYVMLLHLPAGYTPTLVRDALVTKIQTLPEQLRRSLTWDQGSEMHLHSQFTQATNMPVYFCDPHAPWQRGSNENTNGLLRQYFPKGTDLSAHTEEHLDTVAAGLNDRPRMTLDWDTPAERMTQLLTTTHNQQQCCNDD
ncbi:IS30 family transposase [Streptomyces sp. MN03-5084-2B]|nr:IS30 family transposase [Streptomyces sp. MN03-5084-2B]